MLKVAICPVCKSFDHLAKVQKRETGVHVFFWSVLRQDWRKEDFLCHNENLGNGTEYECGNCNSVSDHVHFLDLTN